MKYKLKKAVITLLVFSMVFLLNDICIFQLFPSTLINTAQAVTIELSLEMPENNSGDCAENESKENFSKNTTLSCCMDGSHKGTETSTFIKSNGAFLKIIVVALFSPRPTTVCVPRKIMVYKQIFEPPDLSIIKTTVLLI